MHNDTRTAIMSHAPYTKYYTQQAGSGLTDIGVLYKSPRYIQKGRGIGDFFGSVYRGLQPLITSGLSVLKDEGLKTTASIINNIGRKPLDDILKEEGRRVVHSLADRGINKMCSGRQGGKGIKRKRRSTRTHLRSKRKRVYTGGRKRKTRKSRTSKRNTLRKRRLQKRNLDIFS